MSFKVELMLVKSWMWCLARDLAAVFCVFFLNKCVFLVA